MEKEFESLVKRQRELHYRISRIVDNLKKTGQAAITAGAVQARLQNLEKYWTKAEDQHEVLCTVHEETFKGHDYFKTDFISEIEDIYLAQQGTLLDMAAHLARPQSAPVAAPRSESSSSRTTLPRIQLPQFTGKFEDWPAFRDLFQSIIGKDTSLSPVEKLHYLKVSVKSDAEALIRNLPTTAENYQRAWTTLTELYENKRLLVRSSLSKFMSLPKMKTESAAELRKILHGASATVGTLESIGRPISSSEDLFVFTVTELFDVRTRREWENTINTSPDPPTYETLKHFLERRLQTLEALQPMKNETATGKSSENTNRTARTHHLQKRESGSSRCSLCKKDHFLMVCDEYKGKTAQERKRFVDDNQLCVNCLGKHKTTECPSKRTCSVCSDKHHTSLHDAHRKVETDKIKAAHVAHGTARRCSTVLLATARILVADRFGSLQETRALVDQGSEATIISEKLAQRLRLPRHHTSVAVFGVGGQQTGLARGRVNLSVWSRCNKESVATSALILPRITGYASATEMPTDDWTHTHNLELADPDFCSTDSIDVLLGADVYASILRDGLRRGHQLQPVAQNTIFGWILSGKIRSVEEGDNVTTHQCRVGDPLSTLVRQFWEQEELTPSPLPLTDEEKECEDLFVRTHTRSSDGRYTVRLPARSSLPDLSETRTAATRALLRSERRFLKNKAFSELYKEFMDTYETMNHMSKIEEDTHTSGPVCYLPHHGVLKESSTSTRLRVVFNGSWTVSSGTSLNQHLHVGKNLLPALNDILLRWRWHRYVLATDVEKMYRQIIVHEEDRDLQRILWRKNDQEKISEYRLNTVTYGLTCAPFLAIRTLRQLAQDEASRFPKGSSVLARDVYVDDVLTGADSTKEALEMQGQLIELCRAGGFPLKKWASNDERLLRAIPEEDRAQIATRTWSPQDTNHHALGLRWNPETDCFSFSVRKPEDSLVTKRSILSQTAQLFDPLGWLTPVIIRAKIAIQSTWLLGLEWDEPLPEREAEQWLRFQAELPALEKIRIPRALVKGSSPSGRAVHGFADASERAYAAVVYLKTEVKEGQSVLSLITAKSKVAPVKQVSLPRLELSAALLLAQLVHHAAGALNLQDLPVYLWTDSMVTLGWIQGHPSRWKTYVANRVAEIQRLMPGARWNHVPSESNPADCASRGLPPGELEEHELWWNGPHFLRAAEPPVSQSLPPLHKDCEMERRVTAMTATTSAKPEEHPMLKRYSTLHRLLRVTGWCQRWLPRNRLPKRDGGQARSLTASEVNEAERTWIRQAQSTHFKKELKIISERAPLSNNNSLTCLYPFLDAEGILRVGGRLHHSLTPLDEKHPVILPPQSEFTRLVVESCHRRSLHGGTQLTLATARQRFWIPRGRGLVKQLIKRCVTCTRWRAATAEQLMGSLPRARVTRARPFQRAGVDYAGPVLLRTSSGRGHKATKAFIAVFVCLSTKAVHLDVVSDYTAAAFIAAFRRFISRRGLCSELVSDCGTTFVGADAELRNLFRASSEEGQAIAAEMAANRVEWRFNPPAAPHFGGLWEAAVKSTKHHLRRVIGDTKLTYEEMATLLSQIEACLNSRPLSALSDDVEDVAALTPGHFLIGAPLTALPEPSLSDVNTGQLSRWQLLQQMRDHFWERWSREYLHGLTARTKWKNEASHCVPGQLCLLLHESTPPSRWPLARIIEVHPGDDGLTRVVTVRTATSEFKRPITKLVLLPTESRDAIDA